MSGLVKHGSIGPFWSNGCEIIRRIFVTVRDKNWQEVAPMLWETEVDTASGNVSMSAHHTNDLVDFAWRGELRIADDGREVTFCFTGRVSKDMDICRLGLVVLHPVAWMAGSTLYVRDSETEQALRLFGSIASQPIIDGTPGAITQPFTSLTIEHPEFGELDMQLEGDLFELEDQRNWGDASFKTYCTPLRLGFPRRLESGTTISHRVHVRFNPARVQISQPESKDRRPATRCSIVFPSIGREWPLTPGAAEPLWRHVLFHLTGNGDHASLMALLEAAPSPMLDIAIRVDEIAQASRALTLLSNHSQRVQRLLLYPAGTSVPDSDDLQRLRLAIEEFPTLRDVTLFAATSGYFVEYNRAVPLKGRFSGIAFPLTATVHSDDADTIVDNVSTIRDIGDTVRDALPDHEIALAPLALYHPRSEPPRQFPAHLLRPWLVASLIEATVAGVSSVTLGTDIINQIAKLPAVEHEPTLLALVSCSGAEVLQLDAADRDGLHAVMLKVAGDRVSRVLAANLSGHPQSLSLASRDLQVPPFGTRLI